MSQVDRIEHLHLVHVTKNFGSFTAVDDLSLTIPGGSFFALLGPSGCGKTTTLRMVAGLEMPTEGQVLLGDRDITTSRPYQRSINTVFQSYALFPHLDIFENVAFGLRRKGVKGKEVEQRVAAVLDLVELASLARRMPGQLSGGQQQRVAVARALVNRPDVLLLDEPLGALDLKLRRQMQIELKRIQAEVGTTFIHVTHDQEEAMTMADTIAVMNAGVIEQMGAPAQMYDLPKTAFVANFLGQANLVHGQISGRDGEHLLVSVPGGEVRVPIDRAADDSGSLIVGIRPEKMRIAYKEEQDVNRVQGTVLDVSFTGVATSYTVATPWDLHRPVTCFELNDEGAPEIGVGDHVDLVWEYGFTFGLDGDDDLDAGNHFSAEVARFGEVADGSEG